jgi:hypothetical protein
MTPSEIYVPPNSQQYPITPGQYAELVESMKAHPEASKLVVSGNTGTVTFQKAIDFSWTYDGTAELLVTIVKDHSLVDRIAGNDAIFATLHEKLIAQLG